MRPNCPEPFGPIRRNGCNRRCGPCTKASIPCATLVQMTPAVYGAAVEPRTLTIRCSSTVTLMLHVSGQSKVQTLARSSRDMARLLAVWRMNGEFTRATGPGARSTPSLPLVPVQRRRVGKTLPEPFGAKHRDGKVAEQFVGRERLTTRQLRAREDIAPRTRGGQANLGGPEIGWCTIAEQAIGQARHRNNQRA